MPPEKTEPAETGPISFDIEPDLTYEIPEETPHIAVDNTGYLIGQEKIAILENCKAGDPFYVVKADTGESVYSGLLEASQTGMVHADFTDLDEAGRYYVWSEDIGASFPFETGEDVYKDLRKEAFRNVKIDPGNTDAACRDLLMYLIADEAGFAAADEEEGKALLETGMKCAEKWFDLNEGTPAMCAVLAGMSIATVKTDVAFSGRCLSAARRMESAYLAAHPEDATGIFLMSTALYRADGSLFDKGRAESFLAAAPEPDLTDENIFYGCAFYLLTRRRVDTLVCERLMKQMTEESSSIAQNDRRSPYMAGEDRNDDRGIFASAIKISFVNYAITNHEYRTALQNYVHYFLGRNSEKKVQIPENSSMGWYLLLMACTQEETAAISEDG